ncbi:anti-CBASS protein Acb1 family protein [Serratia inhibens]
MNESQMKSEQRAANSKYKDRAGNLSLLLSGTSNTKRERLYQEFGYPVDLCFEDFYRAYKRNAIAAAAVKRMLDCWEDFPEVYEGDKTKDATQQTEWDKSIAKLLKRCWKQIRGADRRNLVGRYSALLIQLKDGGKWNEAVNTAKVKSLKERALVRLIPAWEAQIEPIRWESDEQSENFGQPTMYSFIELPVHGQRDAKPGRIIDVHPDRVIILAEGADDDNLGSGTSLLEAGFNSLLDIEKVSGGSSEGFLKNASRQLNYNFSDKTNFSALAKALGVPDNQLADALDEQARRLNNNTDAASFMQAGTAEVLSVTASDPEPTWRTALSAFCSTVPIAVKVLIGQITGERASTEDNKDWARTRMTRRNGFLSDTIIDIVNRFWMLGVIDPPSSDEITVEWSDLLAPSEAEKIANMDKKADVAVKTQNAFGRSAVTENEIRAAGEMQAIPEFDSGGNDGNKQNRPDPLVDDEKA